MRNFILLCIICTTFKLSDFKSDVFIIDETGQSVTETIGPVNEGSGISLLCETKSDEPFLLTWWKDTVLLDDSFVTMSQGSLRNQLTLAYLDRTDLMSTLTCQAALPNNTLPSETSVSVDMNLKPLNVHITSLQRPLSANRHTVLKCQSSGSRPPAIITWWIGSKQMTNATAAAYDSTTISKLIYVPQPDDHGRTLSCRATNPAMDGHILEDHRPLNIHYTPLVSVTVGAPHSYISKGESVYFDCSIRANPPVTEVGWRFNNQPLYVQDTIKVQNQSLLLHNISSKSSGNYSCVAANAEGEGVSDHVTIKVHYAPVCSLKSIAQLGVPLGESVDIQCQVDAYPEPTDFIWFLNNTFRKVPLKSFTVNGSESTLTFTPKKGRDYGHIMCAAQNAAGIQKEGCCFTLHQATVPNPVIDCLVQNESTTSALVHCTSGCDGGLHQQFHLELYSPKGLVATAVQDTEPVFKMEGLPSGVSLIAVVFATNRKGRSNAVAFTVATEALLIEDKSPRKMKVSPFISILILMIMVLVAAAVYVACFSRHAPTKLATGLPETPTTTEPMILKPEDQYIYI